MKRAEDFDWKDPDRYWESQKDYEPMPKDGMQFMSGIEAPDLSKPIFLPRVIQGIPGLFRSSRPGYPNKLVGKKVMKDAIIAYRVDGIQAIVCLLTDGEYFKYYGKDLVGYYRGHGFKVYRYPVPDFGTPRVEFAYKMAKDMDDALNSGQKVVVHCSAGQGRTGLAINLLIEYRKFFGATKQPKGVTAETLGQKSFLTLFRRHLTRITNRKHLGKKGSK